MFGFLNVFLAALFARDGTRCAADAPRCSKSATRARFTFSATGVTLARPHGVRRRDSQRTRVDARHRSAPARSPNPSRISRHSDSCERTIKARRDARSRAPLLDRRARTMPRRTFPIQNLPFGVFRHDFEERPRVGIAIGDQVLDCLAAARAGCFASLGPRRRRRAAVVVAQRAARARPRRRARDPCRGEPAAAQRTPTRESARRRCATRSSSAWTASRCSCRRRSATTPISTRRYFTRRTSARCSVPTRRSCRTTNTCPIGYHGRASSIVASGTPVRRPRGQTKPDANAPPVYGPSKSLDYELEIGALVCGENAIGETVPIARAEERIFGLCLLERLVRARHAELGVPAARPVPREEFCDDGRRVGRDARRARAVPHAGVRAAGRAIPRRCRISTTRPIKRAADSAITLEVWLRSAAMRAADIPAVRLSSGSFESMYWTVAQLLAHHSSNGCNLRPGDLLGSGTVSGPEKESRGCLLELASRGAEPVTAAVG